ncbi:MAG: hypothetical protein ACFFCW_49840 [Candidatus Hodarchaeota archaeon]
MTPEELLVLLFVLFALCMLVVGIPVGLAWRLFLRTDSTRLPPRRRNLAIVGLSGISLSAAGFLGMLIHVMLIGFSEPLLGVYLAWAGPGGLLALLSPWLVLASIGWSRVVGFVAGLVLLYLWSLSAVPV